MFCFISGCPNATDCSKDSKKRIVQIYFNGPEDEGLFKQWQQAIPQTNKVFSRGDKLCDFHFKKSEVVLFNETKLPNGNVRRVPMVEPTLKSGTVPSIFPKTKATQAEVKKTSLEKQKSTPKRKLSSSGDESDDAGEPLPPSTPKRRGRPRKYPLSSSPEKKKTPATLVEKRRKVETVSAPIDDDYERLQKSLETSEDSNEEISQEFQDLAHAFLRVTNFLMQLESQGVYIAS